MPEVQLTSNVAGLALVAVTVIGLPALGPETPAPAIVESEFVFERAPFPSAHASTIAETRDGLVAAWFGGTQEKNPDVSIWVARRRGSRVVVAGGGRQRRAAGWDEVRVLESRAVPADERSARVVLQSRSESK